MNYICKNSFNSLEGKFYTYESKISSDEYLTLEPYEKLNFIQDISVLNKDYVFTMVGRTRIGYMAGVRELIKEKPTVCIYDPKEENRHMRRAFV